MQGNWDNARDGSLETRRLELLTTSGQERLGGFMEEMFELVLQGRVGVHQRRKAKVPFISQYNGEVK